MDNKTFNKIANKLVAIDDKFSEIESIAKMITIWVKDRDWELIPAIELLNSKISDVNEIIKKV